MMTTLAPEGARKSVGRALLLCTDALALVLPLIVLFRVYGIGPGNLSGLPVLFTAVLALALAAERRLYHLDGVRCTYTDLWRLSVSTLLAAAIAIVIIFITGNGSAHLTAFRFYVLITLLVRPAARITARDLALSHGYRTRVLIVGAGSVGQRVAATFIRQYAGSVEVVGFVDDTVSKRQRELLGLPVYQADSLCSVITSRAVEHVVVAFSRRRDQTISAQIRKALTQCDVQVSIVPRFYEAVPRVEQMVEVRDIPLAVIRSRRNVRGQLLLKRVLDIVVAGTALLVSLPVMLVAAFALVLDGQRQILFRQERIGRGGQPFTMYKLCSMRPCRPGEDPYSSDRQTRVGKLLRKTSIDELPQLWNIVRGDMSLVGPRPEVAKYVDMCSKRIDRYADRHRVPGGLTGLAQVTGLRGNTSLVERARLDNYYIDNWSLMLDLKILVRTFTAFLAHNQGIGGDLAFKDIVAEVAETARGSLVTGD